MFQINIVIPMAGYGSRFSQEGYINPKPLIDVNGKPMIQRIIENIHIEGAHYIFIVLKEHYEKYNLENVLSTICPKCDIVCLDKVTQGAACTVLEAQSFINNSTPLLIANSDQILEWDVYDFLSQSIKDNIDGSISVFKSNDPKFSYARLNSKGYVIEVAEKVVISPFATTGVYYWKHGSDFCSSAYQMIEENIRVNNEFYVAPVYNIAIKKNKIFKTINCDTFYSIGTPDDLKSFLTKI